MQNKNKNVTFFENFFSLNFHNLFCWKNDAKMQQKSEAFGLAAKLYCRITRYLLSKNQNFLFFHFRTLVNPSAIELPSIPKDTTNNAIDLYL